MLQVFYTDFAKVDRDVGFVAIVCTICCKRLFLMFHLFFRHMLQLCLYRYCVCFTRMFYVFLFRCYVCFAMVFKCFFMFTSVSSVLFYMLQVLHLDVSKVDIILHM
jgi:hypothetical protein